MKTRDYHLTDERGEPFFWLADTAWNLWCKGTPEEWEVYLSTRKRQGFTAIQFVAGWWRGCTQPRAGRPFDLEDGNLVYDEAAWKSLDLLFERIRAHGLVPSPIMLWTLTDIDPGQVLSEEQCIAVARKQLQRWDGPDVVWLLGGDGNYTSDEARERWKRIGRAVFQGNAGLATLHPCGVTWVGDAFGDEPWYDIATIQSGHGSQDEDLRFLVDGEYANAWTRLTMPFLNLEPNYEDALSYHVREHLTDFHVRRASYWSLLVAPPAGVTYGIGSVWMWATESGEIAENHDKTWAGKPWDRELETPGAWSMTTLREIFQQLPWTALRPAQALLCRQPGTNDLRRRQVVAATESRDCVVAYSPDGAPVAIASDGVAQNLRAWQVNPRTGEWTEIGPVAPVDGVLTLDAGPTSSSAAAPESATTATADSAARNADRPSIPVADTQDRPLTGDDLLWVLR